MDLKELLKPNKEKIIASAGLIIISILLAAFGVYFAGFNFPIIFIIMIYYFYIPIILAIGAMYSIIPSIRPDMDTMNASQFLFHFGLMFVLSCVYAYFISCIVLFIFKKDKKL